MNKWQRPVPKVWESQDEDIALPVFLATGGVLRRKHTEDLDVHEYLILPKVAAKKTVHGRATITMHGNNVWLITMANEEAWPLLEDIVEELDAYKVEAKWKDILSELKAHVRARTNLHWCLNLMGRWDMFVPSAYSLISVALPSHPVLAMLKAAEQYRQVSILELMATEPEAIGMSPNEAAAAAAAGFWASLGA